MDKTWIDLPKLDVRYIQGVIDFMDFAKKNRQPKDSNEIVCPCTKCRNVPLVEIDLVADHLIENGFMPSYTRWIFHGEKSASVDFSNENSAHADLGGRDEMQEMLHEAFGIFPPSPNRDMGANDLPRCNLSGPDEETENFFMLLKEAERELYPGCQKFSLLSFVGRLMHIKCLSGWSNKSFTMLLKLLKDVLPEGETLPNSFNASRKLLGGLGLDYHKVHACPKDCMLYWGENSERLDCKICHQSRYKQFEGEANETSKEGDKIPQKVVRYFPLIPRLKRLYMSSKTTSLMRWHAQNPAPNGIMRHPVDSNAWKHFDQLYPDFAQEPRNVRLGLASDGLNPFQTMSISHSTWPVVMMTYNLPHWLCMKQPYLMLSLLIDGPQAPGNDIDIYLSLIVEELKELWGKGVDTYDSSTNEMFRMRASLLWTIHDFPGYAYLSGWSTKGKLVCPCCHVKTPSRYLAKGRKTCYLGHHRWLDNDHKF